jgi:hypothetical protein
MTVHGAPKETTEGDGLVGTERTAVADYLRRYAKAERKRAHALRGDAEPDARCSDRVVRALEGAAEIIEQGRHWR